MGKSYSTPITFYKLEPYRPHIECVPTIQVVDKRHFRRYFDKQGHLDVMREMIGKVRLQGLLPHPSADQAFMLLFPEDLIEVMKREALDEWSSAAQSDTVIACVADGRLIIPDMMNALDVPGQHPTVVIMILRRIAKAISEHEELPCIPEFEDAWYSAQLKRHERFNTYKDQVQGFLKKVGVYATRQPVAEHDHVQASQ